jgi:dTDP-4-dehydrorhamnose 3,5-epimerase
MRFSETPIAGAYLIEGDPVEDQRGVFMRTWCAREFAEQGLQPHFVQASMSLSRRTGTIRGLHFQTAPNEETKLVRCIQGALFDVIVDLRPLSPTFRRTYSVELSSHNHRSLYIPKTVAHGFQTLQDNTEVLYSISEPYKPESACGIRWNDASLNISWPLEVTAISDRDSSLPLLEVYLEHVFAAI